MNKFTLLGMAAMAIAASGPVFAQGGAMGGPPMADPYGDATIAKADAEKAAGARFDQLDTNHDGSLSADEVEAAANGPGGRGLRRADTDGDGKVTKDEFLAGQKQRFDMIDADHDGQLTKAERDAYRAQMRARMQQQGGMGGSPGQ
ncbi:MAG: EF-hand domain-containing protein [Sphingomonadales bacterium]|nr:EF-hand domain-containing protein [Sphingomonadales bacterium]